jgi:hypothetical protein
LRLWDLLGVVFGDIGTSPLYALKTVLDLTGDGSRATVLGILTLIVWTLIAITTIKYVTIAMRVDNDGEGGILTLMALLEFSLDRGVHRKGIGGNLSRQVPPWRPRSSVGTFSGHSIVCCIAYCEVKIAFGIMPWMPLVPSTTWERATRDFLQLAEFGGGPARTDTDTRSTGAMF